MKTKLILDTDIGTDVDDAWALALCLASGEIDLLGVTLVHADLETRARVALKLLKSVDRLDVLVYKGTSEPLTPGARLYWAGHEGTDTDFEDIRRLAARDGAVDFILDTIEANPGEVVLCPIGPFTNVAEALRRGPETMRKLKRLVIMGMSYAGEGADNAAIEHNARVDPDATREMVTSGIPATITGFNVTTQVSVRRDDLPALEGNAFGDYLSAMTCQLFKMSGQDRTWMHDPLAVATVFDPTLVTTRKMVAQIGNNGASAFESTPDGHLDVCVEVDAPRFEKSLISRIADLVRRSGGARS